MDKLPATQVVGKVQPSSRSSSNLVSKPRLRITADNLPNSYDYLVDVALPNRLWSGWIPKGGARMLSREMLEAERAAIVKRFEDLEPAVLLYMPGEDDRVSAALLAMISSFPTQAEQAVARVHLIKQTIREFPAWAIEKACAKIRQKGYEVRGSSGISESQTHWAPSDPEIYAAVEKEIEGRKKACDSARALLEAPVEPKPDPKPSSGKTVEEMHAEFKAKMGGGDLLTAKEAEDRRAVLERSRVRSLVDRRQEFIDAGLEPPESATSLPMMLKMGWRIEEFPDGTRRLVK